MRLILLRAGILLALAPFLLLAAFNHPYLDDYQNAYYVRAQGLGATQLSLYHSWTGRYASTFVMTALNPLVYNWLDGVKVAAAGLLLLHWASLTALLRTVLHTALRRPCTWGTAGWVAAILLTIFCNAAPEPYSFLYWFTGAVAYQVPYLGLLNFVTLAVRAGWGTARGARLAAGLALPCLVLAVAGNELLLLQALLVLGALAVWLPPPARRAWWSWALVGLVAAAVAVAAPGNWQRAAQTYPGDHSQRLLLLLPRAIYSYLAFLLNPAVAGSWLAALLLGLRLGGQATDGEVRRWTGRHWRGLLLGFGALNGVGFFLFRYVWVEPPVLRAQNEILAVLLLSTLLLSWAAAPQLASYRRFVRRLHWGLPLLLLGMFATGHVRHAWLELCTSAPAYDQQMQARYRRVRAAQASGQPAVMLPPLQLVHRQLLAPLRQRGYASELDVDLVPGCSGHTNEAMARYFGLRQVCLTVDSQQVQH